MTLAPDLSPDDWRRISDALRYLGRVLWEEMNRCLNLADRLAHSISAKD